MESVQKVIEIPKYVDMYFILGPKDKNLTILRKYINIRVTIKDNNICIFGNENSVNQAEKVFSALLEYYDDSLVTAELFEWIINSVINNTIVPNDTEDLVLQYGKKKIVAKTPGQQRFLQSIKDNYITICTAPPGAGKTMISVCYGLHLLLNKEIDKIIITRPMVEAKGENNLGSLPGEKDDKLSLFMLPMLDVFKRTLGVERLHNYIEKEKIEMLPLGYMRGVSLENTYLVADEFENSNIILSKLLVTRLGINSKIVVCGDPIQQDSRAESGLIYLSQSLSSIPGIGVVKMDESDIVRHPILTNILNAFKEYDMKKETK